MGINGLGQPHYQNFIKYDTNSDGKIDAQEQKDIPTEIKDKLVEAKTNTADGIDPWEWMNICTVKPTVTPKAPDQSTVNNIEDMFNMEETTGQEVNYDQALSDEEITNLLTEYKDIFIKAKIDNPLAFLAKLALTDKNNIDKLLKQIPFLKEKGFSSEQILAIYSNCPDILLDSIPELFELGFKTTSDFENLKDFPKTEYFFEHQQAVTDIRTFLQFGFSIQDLKDHANVIPNIQSLGKNGYITKEQILNLEKKTGPVLFEYISQCNIDINNFDLDTVKRIFNLLNDKYTAEGDGTGYLFKLFMNKNNPDQALCNKLIDFLQDPLAKEIDKNDHWSLSLIIENFQSISLSGYDSPEKIQKLVTTIDKNILDKDEAPRFLENILRNISEYPANKLDSLGLWIQSILETFPYTEGDDQDTQAQAVYSRESRSTIDQAGGLEKVMATAQALQKQNPAFNYLNVLFLLNSGAYTIDNIGEALKNPKTIQMLEKISLLDQVHFSHSRSFGRTIYSTLLKNILTANKPLTPESLVTIMSEKTKNINTEQDGSDMSMRQAIEKSREDIKNKTIDILSSIISNTTDLTTIAKAKEAQSIFDDYTRQIDNLRKRIAVLDQAIKAGTLAEDDEGYKNLKKLLETIDGKFRDFCQTTIPQAIKWQDESMDSGSPEAIITVKDLTIRLLDGRLDSPETRQALAPARAKLAEHTSSEFIPFIEKNFPTIDIQDLKQACLAIFKQQQQQGTENKKTVITETPTTITTETTSFEKTTKLNIKDALALKTIAKLLQKELEQKNLAERKKAEEKEVNLQTQATKALNLNAAQIGLLKKYGITEGDPAVMMSQINKLLRA